MDQCLLDVVGLADRGRKGFLKRLEGLWVEHFPGFPKTSAALMARYRRIVAARGGDEPPVGDGNTVSSSDSESIFDTNEDGSFVRDMSVSSWSSCSSSESSSLSSCLLESVGSSGSSESVVEVPGLPGESVERFREV